MSINAPQPQFETKNNFKNKGYNTETPITLISKDLVSGKMDSNKAKIFLKENGVSDETVKKYESLIKSYDQVKEKIIATTEDALMTLLAFINPEKAFSQSKIIDQKRYDEVAQNGKSPDQDTKTNEQGATEKATIKIPSTASKSQKDIWNYFSDPKNADVSVSIKGKKYTFDQIKKSLADGKDGKITQAFLKVMNERKNTEKKDAENTTQEK